MQRDHYAFRRAELSDILNELKQEAEAFGEAKQQRDKNARAQAEKQMRQAAGKAVKIEPHLAYLWLEAEKVEREQQEREKTIYANAANAVQDEWRKILTTAKSPWDKQRHDFARIPQEFKFAPTSNADIAGLPPLSFLLVIPFRLKKPYLSKDDRSFYLLDNPLRRDKVFQTPMVAPTAWKGALRSAMVRELVAWWQGLDNAQRRTQAEEFASRRFRMARLFGDEKGEEPGAIKGLAKYLDDVGGRQAAQAYRQLVREYFRVKADDPMPHFQGRLHFFSTFFDTMGLEVINPHERQTGVGARGPILVECVPQGARGDLFLLYVPFGPMEQSEKDRRSEVAEDLEILAKGIQAMLTTYGFGAKTSSGFGIAQDQLAAEGRLAIRAELAGEATPSPDAAPKPKERKLPLYLESPGVLHPDLRRADGTLKSEDEYRLLIEGQGKKYSKKHKQLYEKAKRWWEREKQKLSEATPQKQESEPELTKAPPVSDYTFRSLSELCELTTRVAE